MGNTNVARPTSLHPDDLESIAGRIEGIAYAVEDLYDGLTFQRLGGETDDEGADQRSWLYLVLLDALRGEAASVRRIAEGLAGAKAVA